MAGGFWLWQSSRNLQLVGKKKGHFCVFLFKILIWFSSKKWGAKSMQQEKISLPFPGAKKSPFKEHFCLDLSSGPSSFSRRWCTVGGVLVIVRSSVNCLIWLQSEFKKTTRYHFRLFWFGWKRYLFWPVFWFGFGSVLINTDCRCSSSPILPVFLHLLGWDLRLWESVTCVTFEQVALSQDCSECKEGGKPWLTRVIMRVI